MILAENKKLTGWETVGMVYGHCREGGREDIGGDARSRRDYRERERPDGEPGDRFQARRL